MLDKTVESIEAAVAGIYDGATILVAGFGLSGVPTQLLLALLEQGARDLTIVNNNGGNGNPGLSMLIEAGRVRKMLCSYARSTDRSGGGTTAVEVAYKAGKIELECVPQGTLAERMRAAAAGMGPFFTPTTYGTPLAQGKESRIIDGKGYVLEYPLKGDFALVRAQVADRWGNLQYRLAARNFSPVMCMAAKITIAQADSIVPLGAIAPEHVMTPGIFVQRVVQARPENAV